MNLGRGRVVDLPVLRNRSRVFRDRVDAGERLAEMLTDYAGSNALILAVPAGGVPVAATAAESLGLALEVVIVSKITLPWDSEMGYGAVAFDGTVRLNDELIARLRLSEDQVAQGIEQTTAKVLRRVKRFHGDQPMRILAGRPLIVIDDGIASGFTLHVAVAALKNNGAETVMVAAPTGQWDSVLHLAQEVAVVYCANVRAGWGFAVADAYEYWAEVREDEVIARLGKLPAFSNKTD